MVLPRKGRVIVDTTAGEIDIELWSKVRKFVTYAAPPTNHFQEAPKACRNLITLAMEGLSVSCGAHKQSLILWLKDIMIISFFTGSISTFSYEPRLTNSQCIAGISGPDWRQNWYW